MRPRSHQLETESRAAFRRALPSAWAPRDLSLDYGIDEEVEIFEDDGAATGLKFAVQLKATDSETGAALRVRFDEAKVQYYRSLPDPVLVVRYVAPEDKLYVRWVHSHDPYYERADENGRTFAFGPEHEWRVETPGELRADVEAFRRFRSAALALPVRVHVVAPTDVCGRGQAEWMVALRNAATPIADVIDIRGAADAEGQLIVTFQEDALVVSAAGVASLTLHLDAHAAVPERLVFDALVAVGLGFQQLGHANVAARVLRAAAPQSDFINEPPGAFMVASCFAEARRVRDALDVALALLDRQEDAAQIAAQVLTLPALEAGDRLTADEREGYERFLARRIELQQAGDGLGQSHYSMANYLRTSGRSRESFRHYRLAVRHDPAYRHRAYFWREVGSVMFLQGRFVSAVDALRRSVALDSDPWTISLLAEALLFAGRFAESEDTVDQYLELSPPGKPDSRLAKVVLPPLRGQYGDVVARDVDEAIRIIDASGDGDLNALDAALRADPLCGLAWFNAGVALVAAGRQEGEAFFAFVMAALAQPGDLEAWCNAIAIGLGLPDGTHAALVIEAAYRLNGERLLVEFGELLRSQPGGPADAEVLRDLSDALASLPRDEGTFELRMVERGNPEVAALVFDRTPPSE